MLFIIHTVELKEQKKKKEAKKAKSTKKKVGTTDSKNKDDDKTKKKKETPDKRANRLNAENKVAKKSFGKNIPLTSGREKLMKPLRNTQSYVGGFVGRLFAKFKKDTKYKGVYQKWVAKVEKEAHEMGLEDFNVNEVRDQYWFVDAEISGSKKSGYASFMKFAEKFDGWCSLGMTKQNFHLNIECYNELEKIVAMLSLANEDKDIVLVTRKWFKKYIDVDDNAVNIGTYNQNLRRALDKFDPKK